MAETTNIEWCDATFNPWIGCTKIGPCCDNCYAENERASVALGVKWGAKEPRHRTSVANWKKPLQWNAKQFYECNCGWRGDDIESHRLACEYPNIGRTRHARRRVFCASLADVFDNAAPTQWRMDLFSLIAATPNLDWLLLTKRIGNVLPMCQHDGMMFDQLSNIWLGITVGNQEEVDRDIPKLLQTPAAVRWISAEPLLGAIDLQAVEMPDGDSLGLSLFNDGEEAGLNWVVVGAESGRNARPMNLDWVRGIVRQCKVAGIPALVKQLSGEKGKVVKDILLFPLDLQIREYP